MTRSFQRAALGLMLATAGTLAHAQFSGSASLASDYRYRGVSLSGGEAAPSLAFNVDSDWGGYAGASVAKARMRYTRVDAQYLVYAGYARRWSESLSWDAGVTDIRYRGSDRYNYRELYAGLSGERFNLRVYTAERYFGVGGRSVYAEINGSYPLADDLDLVGHLGYLVKPQTRTDLRVGLSAALGEAWMAQLAWVAARDQAPLYSALYTRKSKQAVLTVTRGF